MERYHKAFVEEFKRNPVTIVEIGSRDGHHAEELRRLSAALPEHVVAVEPHPISFKGIIANYPQFRVYQLAISNTPGVLSFNAVPDNFNVHIVGTSSLLKVVEEKSHLYPPANWIKVLAVTGETLLQLIDWFEIDACKIDVEGLTFEVLESFGPSIRIFKSFHIEVEEPGFQIWEGQKNHIDIGNLLTRWGFKEMYYQPMFWAGQQGDSVWMRQD